MFWFPGGKLAETIGGGNLEQQCLDEARALWEDPDRLTALIEYPLSAKLGQCCGGHVRVFISKRLPKTRVVLCGAGHVSTALAHVLAETPFEVTVVDARAEWADPKRFPECVEVIAEDPEAFVRDLGPEAERVLLLIMTHQHALDEALCRLALRHPFRWRGLIGSRTKWRRFRQRLAARGFSEPELDKITSPIGDPKLGRSPREIAVGAAAQLLAVYHGAQDEGAAPADERPPGKRAALILAGGASRRMGRWKGGLLIDGEPLVMAHARVFTSAGADLWKALYPPMYRDEAERIIPPGHRIGTATPESPLFASLQLGLAELIRECPDLDSVLMTPVDTVPLDEDWVAALWDRHEGLEAWATRPEVATDDPDRPTRHGHPVILGHRLFATILTADPDDTRLDFLLRDLPQGRAASFEIPSNDPLTNLNTPSEFIDALAE